MAETRSDNKGTADFFPLQGVIDKPIQRFTIKIKNHSGIGDNHLEPSVGQYEVEYLNNLMVRLIGKYLQ